MACRCKKSYFLFSESLVHLKETGDAVGFGGLAGNKAVGLHDSTVVVLMGAAEFGRHGYFVVQIGEAAVRVLGAGIQDSLGGGFNAGDMFGRYARMRFGANGRKAGPREVVIDDIF